MMLRRRSDENPEARDTLFDAAPTIQAPIERHWFVPDDTDSYCLACNLPRNNRRHARRAA